MALNDRSRGRARNKTRNKAQELKGRLRRRPPAEQPATEGLESKGRADQTKGPPQAGRRESQGRLPAQALGGPAADQAASATRVDSGGRRLGRAVSPGSCGHDLTRHLRDQRLAQR